MDNDKIERLRKRLFRKGETFKEREVRSPLSPSSGKAKTYWEAPEEGPLVFPEKPKPTLLKKIIIVLSVVFSLAALGAAISFFTAGPNVASSKNIEISMIGPTSIKGGEPGSWQIVITNKNKTSLELADLIIEYPEGSKAVSGSLSGTKTLSERRSLGQIGAGQTINEVIGAYLFGEKDTDKAFKFTLEFRPQGFNAILVKNAEQSVRLLQSPIEISINLPKETNAGEEFDLEANITSNAQAAIKDVNLKIDYPIGFQYIDSDLKPASGDNVWRLGDFEPNKVRTVKIKGVIQGQDLMELAFRASAGPLDEKGEVVAYGFNVQNIVLKKPFLKLGVEINDKTEETIASAGTDLKVNVGWQNTLPTKITNAVIEVKINGSAVNQRTIFADKGFYRSFDQVLVWNQSSFPDLASIEPLQEGKAQFKFYILDRLPDEVIRQGNPVVSLDITMKAQRISEQGMVEVTNHLTKDIKVATLLQLSRRGLYYSGPFKNSGPLPPKIGKETTYTVSWSLTNSSNIVSDVTVSAYLPSYVRWLKVINPENADVSYDETTGGIVWRPGVISAGAGILGPAKELAFQISFLPNAAQIGSQPTLVSEAVLGGKDTFTGAYLRDVRAALTTYLDTDPQFKYNDANVIQ